MPVVVGQTFNCQNFGQSDRNVWTGQRPILRLHLHLRRLRLEHLQRAGIEPPEMLLQVVRVDLYGTLQVNLGSHQCDQLVGIKSSPIFPKVAQKVAIVGIS